MPRTETEELDRAHFWIYAEDKRWLMEMFGKGTPGNIGASLIVRRMIRAYRKQLEAKAEGQAKRVGTGDDKQLDADIAAAVKSTG